MEIFLIQPGIVKRETFRMTTENRMESHVCTLLGMDQDSPFRFQPLKHDHRFIVWWLSFTTACEHFMRVTQHISSRIRDMCDEEARQAYVWVNNLTEKLRQPPSTKSCSEEAIIVTIYKRGSWNGFPSSQLKHVYMNLHNVQHSTYDYHVHPESSSLEDRSLL